MLRVCSTSHYIDEQWLANDGFVSVSWSRVESHVTAGCELQITTLIFDAMSRVIDDINRLLSVSRF